jgi:polyhydroxyalkanoate synthase
VRLKTAPGGHLGVLTGRAAVHTTWPLLDAFLDEPAAARPAPPRGRKPARRRQVRAAA